MYKNQALFFTLLILNITMGSNEWKFFGLNIGVVLFYLMSVICVLHNIKSKYFLSTILLSMLVISFKFLSLIVVNQIFTNLADLFSAVIFMVFGALSFGLNLSVLYKNLLKFVLLSIPIMYLQIYGLSTFFYGWNVELFHENFLYSFDEVNDIGKIFKDIPLFPTLFVGHDDLIIPMYQSRPTGFLYSNNVFSIFISLLMALHFSFFIKYITKTSFFVISFSAILSGSTLVLSLYLILSIYFLFRSKELLRRNLLSLCSFLFAISLNFILFPGLITNNLSVATLATKYATRFLYIFDEIGFNGLLFFYNLSGGIDYSKDKTLDLEGTSSFLIYLLDIKVLSFILVVFLILYILAKRRLNTHKNVFKNINLHSYFILFFTLILTQVAIPFIFSPFFHVVLGAVLAPFIINTRFFKYDQ